MEASRIVLDQVHPRLVPPIWLAVSPELQRALDLTDGEMSLETVFQELTQGTMQLWAAHDGPETYGFVVTCVADYDNNIKIARVILMAGKNLDRAKHLIRTLESWAASEGCQYIDWWGRPGLERMFAPMGYKRKYVICRKKLPLGQFSGVLH